MKREIRKLYKSGDENNEFSEEPTSSEEEEQQKQQQQQQQQQQRKKRDQNSDNSDEELDNLNSADELLYQDDVYDEVEDDILNQLLKYTSKEDFRKTIKKIKKNEGFDWSDDEGENKNKERRESFNQDESSSSSSSSSDYDDISTPISTSEETPFIDEIDNDDLKDDIEQNRDVLRRSLARSIIKSPIKSPIKSSKPSTLLSPSTIEEEEEEINNAKDNNDKEEKQQIEKELFELEDIMEKQEGIELKDFSRIKKRKEKRLSSSGSIKSSKSSSSASTVSSIKSAILRKSTMRIEKAKRYIIPPKLLMEMDDIELIREDICAIDRSLAGYARTGMAIIGLGVGLISKLGFSTSTIIVTISYFLFGVVLIAVGIVRCRTVIKYIKKGYMKPSIYSIVIITLSTLAVIGFSFYGVVSSS
ncbi:hypothetical protein ACTA71_003563 [Dictyostelium dimigraforme]